MNWSATLRWGLVGGLLTVILSLLIYFISPDSFASLWVVAMFFLAAMFFMIWGGIDFRKENNNQISYLHALAAVMIIAAIISLMSTLFSYVLTTYIDPQLSDLIKQKVVQNTTEMMEKMGATDDKIDEAIDSIKNQDFNFGVKQYLSRYAQGLLFYLFFGFLIALFVKRNPDQVPTTPQ
jgi:parvulin-like peptidyl-prolyl isomerase